VSMTSLGVVLNRSLRGGAYMAAVLALI